MIKIKRRTSAVTVVGVTADGELALPALADTSSIPIGYPIALTRPCRGYRLPRMQLTSEQMPCAALAHLRTGTLAGGTSNCNIEDYMQFAGSHRISTAAFPTKEVAMSRISSGRSGPFALVKTQQLELGGPTPACFRLT
jgi:hypothetical protein